MANVYANTPFAAADKLVVTEDTAEGVKDSAVDIGDVVTADTAFGTNERVIISDGTGKGVKASTVNDFTLVNAMVHVSQINSSYVYSPGGGSFTIPGAVMQATGSGRQITSNTSVLINNVAQAASNFSGSGVLVQSAGANKSLADSGIAAANVVTASSAFGTDDRLIISQGTGKSVEASNITITEVTNALKVMPGGRLTLTSGVPVTTAEVIGGGTVYYTPYISDRISLYDGVAWKVLPFTEMSISLATGFSASTTYDVFAYINAGAVALETVAWSSATARTTNIGFFQGSLVKDGDSTRLYLGSFRTDGTGTGTHDYLIQRFVYNYYNKVNRKTFRGSTTASWTYTGSTAWRNTNNVSTTIQYLIGYPDVQVSAALMCCCQVDTGWAEIGIGGPSQFAVDPVNTNCTFARTALTEDVSIQSLLEDSPAIGIANYFARERVDNAATTLSQNNANTALFGFTGSAFV
jgi:hypothetical protein